MTSEVGPRILIDPENYGPRRAGYPAGANIIVIREV